MHWKFHFRILGDELKADVCGVSQKGYPIQLATVEYAIAHADDLAARNFELLVLDDLGKTKELYHDLRLLNVFLVIIVCRDDIFVRRIS